MTLTCPQCKCRIELLTGEPLNLTLTEHRLLAVLRRHPLHCFTQDELLQIVWEWPSGLQTATVRQHISRLRRKLAEAGYPDAIENVKGRGWRLVPEGCSVQAVAA